MITIVRVAAPWPRDGDAPRRTAPAEIVLLKQMAEPARYHLTRHRLVAKINTDETPH